MSIKYFRLLAFTRSVSSALNNIHDNSITTTFARADLHDHGNATLIPAFLPGRLDAFSSPIRSPPRAGESFTAVPPPDSIISVPASWQPMGKIITGGTFYIPAISLNPVTTQPSTSKPPPMSKTSTSQPDAVADRCTLTDVLDIPPSLPTLDMFPTESHLSTWMQVFATPFAFPPQLTSALDLGTTEDEGNPKAKERDTLEPPTAMRIFFMATPDLPPQSPLPLSVTDVAFAGPSQRSLDAEYT
ncbi:hypothetical protein EDB85DRAFT_2162690 [Lactarius pseudohatsudake]|nr:hypothetical protein EDB85DRAFT_2162690 [Lactarius pseudohatsudake]